MAQLLFRLGKLLVVSRRHKMVRMGLVYLFTNFLVASAVVFTLTLILLLMGMGNLFLPLTSEAWAFLAKMVF